jgi:hypothetical protein
MTCCAVMAYIKISFENFFLVFCVMSPCGLVGCYKHFRSTLVSTYKTTTESQPRRPKISIKQELSCLMGTEMVTNINKYFCC